MSETETLRQAIADHDREIAQLERKLKNHSFHYGSNRLAGQKAETELAALRQGRDVLAAILGS